jgi:hypothetical protein
MIILELFIKQLLTTLNLLTEYTSDNLNLAHNAYATDLQIFLIRAILGIFEMDKMELIFNYTIIPETVV